MTLGILLALLVTAGAAVFVLVAAHYRLFGLALNPEIRPIAVLTLAVNVVIAVFLKYYLVNSVSNRRAEKDLLIANVGQATSTLRSCREALDTCAAAGEITGRDRTKILRTLRRLSNDLEASETSLEMSGADALCRAMGPVWDLYVEYKAAATGGEFPAKPYSQTAISAQQRAYRRLARELHSLIFKINRRH